MEIPELALSVKEFLRIIDMRILISQHAHNSHKELVCVRIPSLRLKKKHQKNPPEINEVCEFKVVVSGGGQAKSTKVCVCVWVCMSGRPTSAHACPRHGLLGAAEAELPAHHAGRLQVPAVVTYAAPLAALQHLHAALAQPGPALQPHCALDN